MGTSHEPREGLWNIKIGEQIPRKYFFFFVENAQIRNEKCAKFKNDKK